VSPSSLFLTPFVARSYAARRSVAGVCLQFGIMRRFYG
jgi:hypothetical protein